VGIGGLTLQWRKMDAAKQAASVMTQEEAGSG
jgi:hypothetical protein